MIYSPIASEGVFKQYHFTADKHRLDLQYVYQLLCTPPSMVSALPPERFALVIKNSLCFSVFYQYQQIGFARVITDYSEFASLWDLFINKHHRSRGVGTAFLKYIFNYYPLRGIFRWFLMTENAHKLYQKFNFKIENSNPYIMMKVSY